MKRLFFAFLLLCILIPTFQSNGQAVGVSTYQKKWLFGMNWGGAWENADVHSRMGTGWGLTLEREIIADNTSVFGFSLRGRYLHTWMWGRDAAPFYGIKNDENLNGTANSSINYISDGYVYRNFYTKTDEFSLEGLLILNKLRAHSGFKIYGFGGIGATGYTSKINQLDGTNNMYDYSTVSTFSKSNTKNDLRNMWDDSYETAGVAGQTRNSYVISAALGVGIGIKLSSNVYLGWEHKYTFTSTDNLDASKWNNDNTPSVKNDRYHYGGLFLTVAIGAGSSTHRTRTQQQSTYYAPPDPKPAITLLFPHENPVYVQDCFAEIKVSITNVTSVNQLTVLKDGNSLAATYYTFDPVTEVLAVKTPIAGNTVFSIIAQNSSGKDTKYVTINCGRVLTEPVALAPTVSIINTSTTDCIANVVASVKNVPGVSSIEVIMDGIILSSHQYHFNPYNGSVTVEAPFNQFTTITIRATSQGNSAVQTVNLTCTPKTPVFVPTTTTKPVISIIKSDIDKSTTGDCVAKISASIIGITSVSMVQVTRNGAMVNPANYAYDETSGVLTINNTILGENTFIIKAQNGLGVTTATVTLDCLVQYIPKLPIIEPIQPSTKNASSTTCRERIAIRVKGVSSLQNIEVLLNGVSIVKNLLRFDVTTSILTFDAVITKQTTIIVNAKNTDGLTSETITISCEPIMAPIIVFTSPATNPFVSSTCSEVVTAIVKNVTDVNSIHVTLNGIVLTSGIAFDAASGVLTIPVNFSGRSELLVNAIGKGGSASKSITLICQPAPKPVITLLTPASNPFVSTTCTEQVAVNIKHIESVSNISVTTNGVPMAASNYNYNAETGVLSFPLQFTEVTSLVITAKNINGSTSQTLSLKCQPIILPKPTIKLLVPTAVNFISKTCQEVVKLQLTNCISKSDITVSVNGKVLAEDKLLFVQKTGMLTFELSVVGTSTIVTTVKNNGGVTSTTLSIQCKPTVSPSVSILEPAGTPVISTQCLENVKAVVTNVTGLSQITVTYNGVSVNRGLLFYDTLTHVLTFSHAFKVDGDIVVQASNEAGQDAKTIALQCRPISEPELNISSPATSPYISTRCNDTVRATVKHITSMNDIAAYANNVAIPTNKILFNQAAGTIAVLTAYTGDTEIKIVVKNETATVTKSVVLNCRPIVQPTISLINPVSENFSSTTCQENVLMTLGNITSIDQIQVKKNSVLVDKTLYTFNASTSLLTIPVDVIGVTTINVLVTNQTTSASKTVQITCNKVSLPIVTILAPSTETAVLTNCTTTLSASVANVTTKEQLIITNNGTVVNAATYTFTNNIVTLPVTVDDRSVMVITATNTTGAASDQAILICNAPTIVVGSSAASCPSTPASSITNCTSCNDTVKVASGDIMVNANQKVCMPNAFNGNVTMNGGQLVICGTATINNFNFNSGDIVVNGNATFSNVNMNNASSAIRNYGTVKFSNITFNGRFENHGQATVLSDFNVNSSAVFINTGVLNATMSFNNNNFVCNTGTIIVGGNLKDNGSATFNNSCKLIVNGQLHIDKVFTNAGSISVASNVFVNGTGRLTMEPSSKLITESLIVNGTIAGPTADCASITIKNETRINSSGSITGKIDLCDVNGIEAPDGSIASSVTTNCSCTINVSGTCGINTEMNDQISICHKPPGNPTNTQTLTVPRSALAAHLAHGDEIGTCVVTTPAPASPTTTTPTPVAPTQPEVVAPVVVPETAPVIDVDDDADKVTICHKPPGNTTNDQTLRVAKSALSAHLNHGDHVGECPNTQPEVEPVAPPAEETQPSNSNAGGQNSPGKTTTPAKPKPIQIPKKTTEVPAPAPEQKGKPLPNPEER